jgi:hypothetical protein
MTKQLLNSNHYPIKLKILQNILISRPPLLPIPPTPKIPNIIPKEQLQALQFKFLANNSHTISRLTQTLKNKTPLNKQEWAQTILEMDRLTTNISDIFIEICA